MKYDHTAIDAKWQKRWMDEKVFEMDPNSNKEKFYCLVEFPYPSGAGLHMGHPRSYVALDVLARKRRMQGYNVLYPMGWDAFGLPAENHAIKTGRKPAEVTAENITTFRRQLQSLGISFDWSREVNTTDPKYYKWTQWMFLEFFKGGLAYKKAMAVNWCLSCKTGLANEEVVNGSCERCGSDIEKRDKEQWMIAITKYADRLIDDLDTVDYLPKIKKQQQDWIGRSEGAEVTFKIEGSSETIKVFTTRPDTLFGATYMVLAPEHPLVHTITTAEHKDNVNAYRVEASKKSDIDRGDDTKEKTGVFTGAEAINPVNGEKIPVWVADYVMMGYGTGAIMAVPGHDERDHAFASKFDLPIVEVIMGGDVKVEAYTRDGTLVNSDFLDGKNVTDAKAAIIDWLEKEGKGERKINYRLRDWVFSRQRYWGEPIPLVKCAGDCGKDTNGWVAVPVDQLPVELPDVEKYEPTDSGESPLAAITDWVNTECPECGGAATRETDTMPNWAGSSWYFLRYIDPHNDEEFASQEMLKQWMPVDWYNGGMEHTTLHLLYSRFWNKFLFDRGHVPVAEPYAKRTSHGLVLADDGTKMSKSKGNGVNPDDVVRESGADALRLYQLFIGPFAEPAPWKTQGVVGVRRFLESLVDYVDTWRSDRDEDYEANPKNKESYAIESPGDDYDRELHKTIKKVTEDIEAMKYNTAVAAMMSFMKLLRKELATGFIESRPLTQPQLEKFLVLVSVFAPHVGEELWSRIGHTDLISNADWPSYDENLAKDDTVVLGVQVNGKVRGEVEIAADASEADARVAAEANEKVAAHLEGKEVQKFIYVPGRIISFVIG